MAGSSIPLPTGDGGAASERRQLTVLFCDITDSTGLSDRCDAEDLREVLLRFQALCATCVEQHGGKVVNYIGDGIRAQFGYPTRSENEAENAARAGLAILRGMEGLNASAAAELGEAVRLRIGIHTGWAVIGSGGSGHVHGFTEIVGDTPNIAARLQEIGEPNSIVVSDATRRLLRDKFRVRALGNHLLKGLSREIRCFQLMGEGNDDIVSRLALPITEMVGRDTELEVLGAVWARVQAGEGQAVEVSGEAGIGKSRLVAEFIRRAAGAAPLYALQASADHQNVPFYPVIRLLEQKSGIRRDEDHESGLAHLRGLLTEAGRAGAEGEWLLGELLGVPVAGPTDLIALDAQEVRRRTRDLLATLLTAHGNAVTDGAGLLLAEDLHWADPSTKELLDRIAGRIAGSRILLVATSRETRLTAHPSGTVARVTLQRLDDAACLALANAMAQNRGLSESLLDSVVARADGIPLFLEELAAAVLETGRLADRAQGERMIAEPHNVPSALYDPLMMRLERLGEAKRIAQMAAVIGRNFSAELLAAVAAEPAEQVAAALEALAESGVVRSDAVDDAFTFKHALVRDVAYHSLLKRQRRELHARVAETLETRFAARAEAEPAYLAQHLAEAGLFSRAVQTWLKAAKQAAEKSANLEAIAQLRAALNEVAQLPPGRERNELELDLQIAMVGPTIAVKGYGAPEIADVSRRALDLCLALSDDPRTLPALYARWGYDRVTGNLREACRLADDFLARAEQKQMRTGRMVGHRLVGTSSLLTRRFPLARDHLERALELYDPEADRPSAIVYSIDVRSTSLSLLCIILWHLGDAATAGGHAQRSLQLAMEMRHAHTLGYAASHVCMFYTLERNVRMVETLAQQVLHAAAERELPFWMTIARTFLGWCEIQSGKLQEGIATLESQREFLQKANLISWLPAYLCWIADAHIQAGAPGEARTVLAQAKDIIARGGETWYEPECWRLSGRLALFEMDDSRARESFVGALALADEHADRGFALRAAMDLAGLLARRGEPDDARALLTRALAPYDQQPLAGDRADAKALLEKLA